MSFTLITVTGKYRKEDGTPASGSVTFTLSSPLIDNSINEFRAPVPQVAGLDASGAFTTQLTATNDPGVTPTGVTYTVQEAINGAAFREYSMTLPYDGGAVDMADVAPAVPGSGGGGVVVVSAHSDLTGLATGDDHPQYQKESEKGATSGYASLDSTTKVPTGQLGSGVADGTTFLRGDQTWAAAGGGGGAPTDANYLVGTANGGLSAEIVVGTTPGGELGGTWASPTVDSVHAGGLAHHAKVQVVFPGNMPYPSQAINLALGWCPVAGTVTKVYALRNGGTGATVNARRAGLALRSADLSVSSADTKTDFGTLQNTAVAAGDLIEMQIVTVAGSPAQVLVQIEITPTA